VSAPDDELRALEDSLRAWNDRRRAPCRDGLRAGMRLSSPDGNGPWTLDYLIQSTSDPSLLVTAADLWKGTETRRRLAGLSGSDPEDVLLSALALAGRLSAVIEKSLRQSHPSRADLDAAQAYAFLKDTAPALAAAGFGLFLPPWWRSRAAPRLGIQATLSPQGGVAGFDTTLALNWRLALGEDPLSTKELEALADLKVPLVQVRGQWVEVDPAALRRATDLWDRRTKGTMTLAQAFRDLREGSSWGLDVSSVRGEGWLKDLLAGDGAFEKLPAPEGLRASLRPYQERGFSWMAYLARLGLGGCLADDMGLGKTLQTLTFLLREKAEGRLNRPALLLCPASVVGNWRKEAEKFTPGLDVHVHHGVQRARTLRKLRRQTQGKALVITTYGTARRDEKLLSQEDWSGVALDEAQNIKNPGAKQSRAVRTLKGSFRFALTGTPVENRLGELWSIFEFLNPGYLGSFDDFFRRFAAPVEQFQDARAADLLRRITRPFLLRRLKTDPKVISDLPEKMEIKVHCPLTREQATLYQAVVKDMLARIEASDGMARRGLVLAALTKLKQALNHPAHFLKDGSALPRRSGKLTRLTEMLEEVTAEGDAALVFTQYTEMGELLKKHVQDTLLEPVLFFHGGLSQTARDKMVEDFQAGRERIMVLSLKAGGTGLNLTRANHVFHYDRWWNPAVENQATDRVFRIGQTKKVQVRKFLCLGTLEERIDAMIESKKALAGQVLGAGENWLTELSDRELKDLFALRAETLEEDA
jgi:SNF2 family DNA or RNA helicase